jgi:hypothetical protein
MGVDEDESPLLALERADQADEEGVLQHVREIDRMV